MVKEEHIEVPRSARYFSIGAAAEEAREIWYVCHGYRQLANRFLRRFGGLVDPSRLIVAPEALSRFYVEGEGREHNKEDRIGATWMTREDRIAEITDYVRYLELLRARVEAPCKSRDFRRVVLGFSQGVHTVCRWIALGGVSPDELILWGGYLPEDLPEGGVAALNRSKISIVWGLLDNFISDKNHARQVLRMREMGLHFDVVEHPGGHEIVDSTLLELSDKRDLGA